eukprot:m.336231 g.336231  ORF g.336231 m.336231 type:complete len:218 (+) comp17790_c0_seq1:204-857(+)
MFKGSKTFRPKKKFKEGTLRHQLHKQASETLNSGLDLEKAVILPKGESKEEWLAVHVVDFFNRVNLIYGTVSDFCTEESCPTMSGGPQYEYHWADGVKYKKPTPLPACIYISLLMDWIDEIINDEKVFPPDSSIPFPKDFKDKVKQIFRRMLRVFVHIYYHHYEKMTQISAEAHINTCYKHFFYFIDEFNLVDMKELEPLKDLTKSLKIVPKSQRNM